MRIKEIEKHTRIAVRGPFSTGTTPTGGKVAHTTLSRPDHYGDRIQGLLDFLLGSYLLLRGNSRRQIELADLYLLPLENEGPTKCKSLAVLLCNGKTNQHGRVDHAGAMRNLEVLVCPVFLLDLHLFYRFHIDREPFPVLRSNEIWLDTKLFIQHENGCTCALPCWHATQNFNGSGLKLRSVTIF
ncbi:hypothetical protein V1525DRAFT_447189 [Lipomyces kononenkoae]|uniref:Uncharacterized protein n=1 Tax=Lipomyces kononenkoae TaxID=34357 RepID=A0ACC3SWH9_LIPKO